MRSSLDWHLDPQGEHTLGAYLEERGVAGPDVDPIPVELFIDYAEWFRVAKRIPVRRARVRDLRRAGGRLEATLEDGHRLRADAVVVAPGVGPFTRLPAWVERAPAAGALFAHRPLYAARPARRSASAARGRSPERL